MQPIEYTLRLCASVAANACRMCPYRDDPQCVTHLKNAAAAEIESYLCGLSDAVEYTVAVNVEKEV